MATRLRSFAKVNLGLAIGPVRGDGFHALLTVYQTIGLHDVVTVEAQRLGGAGGRLAIESNDPRVPNDGRNTAWRMVEAALRRAGVVADVRVHIEKRLPVQGGLGAGSANAAAALLGLERELGVRPGDPDWLSRPERLEIAAGVGSDVPLFLLGGTVLGEERGERVRALPGLGGPEGGGWPCVVAVPGVGVSTPAAFRAWDERVARQGGTAKDALESAPQRLTPKNGELFRGTAEAVPLIQRSSAVRFRTQPERAGTLTDGTVSANMNQLSLAYAAAFGSLAGDENGDESQGLDPSGTVGDLASDEAELQRQPGERDGLAENPLLTLVRAGIANDFEQVVFSQHSLLRSTKRELVGCDSGAAAVYAALSGSGSALFGLYRTTGDAMAAQRRVESLGVRTLLTETVTRERYWSEMFF